MASSCCLAAVYQMARDFKDTELFIGARDKKHLFYLGKFAKVHVATDDGSYGEKGFVTVALKKRLEEIKEGSFVFYNCGPEKMILAAIELEKNYTTSEYIYSSIDYKTGCGVGLCGSCSTPNGKRLCVDGPFFKNEN